jgi:hypothetical protein
MDSQLDKEVLYSNTTEWQRGLSLLGEVETLFLSNLLELVLVLRLGDLVLLRLMLGGKRRE